MDHDTHLALRPKLISFDVFGTLISVRDSSYSAFERILADAGAHPRRSSTVPRSSNYCWYHIRQLLPSMAACRSKGSKRMESRWLRQRN
jgi:hypothetical protein